MGRKQLGHQTAARSHYTTKKRKDSIKKATASRHNKPSSSTASSSPASTSSTALTSSASSSAASTSSTLSDFNTFRIMNLDKLSSHLQHITEHSASCGGSCVIEGETYRAGLACVIQAKCSKCQLTFSIPSSPHFVRNKRKVWTVNLGAVLGQMATGGGASNLQQVMASVGVASMSKSTFTATERYITEDIKSLLVHSMIEAGNTERQLAIENNDYFQGVPAITVIGDGGWSKRSHKHSYNAKSGVAVIIGRCTKKLLFLGVRNKYCSTCSIAQNAGKEPPSHQCYRNWNGSSPAMESDILVEGFRQAEQTHGVRYMHLVGDGDSSVLSSIHQKVPEWGRFVRKIECVNHCLKNYRAKLELIVKENPAYKGAGKLTQNQIKRLTAGARAAIRMHAPTRNVEQLRHDLRNGPHHVFGDHSKCNQAFCTVRGLEQAGERNDEQLPSDTGSPAETSTLQEHLDEIIRQEQEDNLSPSSLSAQEEAEARSGYTASLDRLPDGLFFKVLRAGDRLVSLAKELIGNQTSNLAESYMGIRTYFDGGKVFNRVQSGSFESRCYAAALKFQEGPQWITHAYQESTGQSPTRTLMDVTNKIERRSAKEGKRKNTQEYKDRRKRAKYQTSGNSHSNDYGPDAAQPDVSPEELQRLCQEYKNSLCVSQSERERIERATREQFAEALWFEQRKCRLTASNFGTVARRRQTTPVGKFVKNLLYDTLREARPLQWGREHEPDARQAYLQTKGTNYLLTHSGLVIDAEHGWLACSPDDLVQDCSAEPENQHGLVEYKCPYSARDTTVEESCKKKDFMSTLHNSEVTLKRTHKYYYQVQGQMAICQKKWCDFVIWTPSSLSIERIAFDPQFWQETLLKLERFYDQAVLPELASPRFPQGQPIREPNSPQ